MIAQNSAHEVRTLTEELKDLITLLRLRLYGGAQPDRQVELASAVDRFLGRFTDHLSDQERDYLPTLRKHIPGAFEAINHLQRDHLHLWATVSRIADETHADRPKEALKAAYEFLGMLLDHVRHQKKIAAGVASQEEEADYPDWDLE